MVGFFFGNVNNKLRLRQSEGRYLGEARAARGAARLRTAAAVIRASRQP
jgi:hypothetical protein